MKLDEEQQRQVAEIFSQMFPESEKRISSSLAQRIEQAAVSFDGEDFKNAVAKILKDSQPKPRGKKLVTQAVDPFGIFEYDEETEQD